MKPKKILAAAALAAVLTVCALHANAQVLYGTLTGNITDASGAGVPAARIEAVNAGTGQVRQSVADDKGEYVINNVVAGTYKVTVSAPSFGNVVGQGVIVDANTVRRMDVQMQLAQVNQSVEVQAAAVTLQADRADVGAELQSAQIAQLPEPSTRNFQSLLVIVPGYAPPVTSHSEAGNPQGALATNVNGASYNNNNTRIEGTSDLYPWLPEIAAYIPACMSFGIIFFG